jgi:hypothetical protein
METSTTGLTVSTVEEFRDPEDAVMIVPPGDSPAATPDASMVATVGTEEAHATLVVISCAVPSAKTPVTLNVWVFPTMMKGLDGFTPIETSDGGVVNAVGV